MSKARRELQKLYIKETTEKIIHLQGVIIKKVEQKEKAHEKIATNEWERKRILQKKVRSYRKQKAYHSSKEKKIISFRTKIKAITRR
ncbi:hypothetical protein ACT7DO_28100 [Bacillus pacificus]